jgi:hypothetical protein
MAITIDKTTYVSKNFNERPPGTTIASLVIHTTEGAFDGDATWLCNPNSGVSTHFVIGPDGTIYQLVDPVHRAWHAGESSYAGKSNYNNFSIGVEISHQQGHAFGPNQQGALTALCKQLLAAYPTITRTYIVMHRQIAPDRKIDPTDVSDAQFAAWADALYIPASRRYQVVAPSAVFTDRRPDSALASGPDSGMTWLDVGDIIQVGQIKDGWLWVSDGEHTPPGIGFLPQSYARPA